MPPLPTRSEQPDGTLALPRLPEEALAAPDTEAEDPRSAGLPAPWLIRLGIITIFLPEGLSFFVFGLRLTVIRLILLAATPLLVVRLGERLISGRFRLAPSDLLVVAAGVWIILAPAQIIGLPEALQHSGPIALEFCIAYLAARILLSEPGQALSMIGVLASTIACVALIGLLDPLFGSYVTHDLATSLTGYQPGLEGPTLRLGLVRATGPLEHSILYGLACGIGLLLALGVEIRARRFTIIACTLGLIFSLSAGPFLGIVIGVGLLLYDRVFARLQHRWVILGGIAALGVIAIFTASNSPLGFVFDHFTFDVQSSYYRLYVWQMAVAEISKSPWFGMGFATWSDIARALGISTSVDSLWLMSALTFGVPGSALIALAMLSSLSASASGGATTLTPAEAKLGTTLGIIICVIVIVGFTVHFWGADWILCGLLAGTSAHLGDLAKR